MAAMLTLGCIGFDEAGMGSILPAPIKHGAGHEDVEPVDAKGRAVGDELGQQPRGKRHEGDGEEKPEMNPCEIARALADVVQLCLLSSPEDAQGKKAHEVGNPLGAERCQCIKQFALAVYLGGGRNVQIKHQQRHGHSKDAVA
jgi:hypothetical protein